jgi:CO/xanthine dehydrogenase Mo-binding subunit
MGEGGILPVAPAIGNALFAAVGTRLHRVPLTPDAVWKAMTKKA